MLRLCSLQKDVQNFLLWTTVMTTERIMAMKWSLETTILLRFQLYWYFVASQRAVIAHYRKLEVTFCCDFLTDNSFSSTFAQSRERRLENWCHQTNLFRWIIPFFLAKASFNTDVLVVSSKVKGETVVAKDSVVVKFPPPVEVYLAWYDIKFCNIYI